jgi:hypothetical protein
MLFGMRLSIRNLWRFGAVLADILCVSSAFAQAGSSFWDHNGSVVTLSADGAGRRFYYESPRAGLAEVGVHLGTLLFEGQKNANRYSGTAYIFSQSCGALSYQVGGDVSPDQRTVTLYSKAPHVDSACNVTGYADDILTFTYRSASTTTGSINQAPKHQDLDRSRKSTEYRNQEVQPGGLTRAQVIIVQQLLLQQGYKVGAPNGKIGPKTMAVVGQLQQKAGVPVTGLPDQQLLDALLQAQ